MLTDIYTNSPLPIAGSCNIRELGGYTNTQGQRLKLHAYLRSDSLHNLPESSKEALYRYGVGCVIDLRSDSEVERHPCVLDGYKDICYHHISMSDNMHATAFDPATLPESMSDLYISLLDEHGQAIRRVFEEFIDHRRSCCLFHCTAGKDRTGVIAMLLLKLAGVDDECVEADYAVSEDNLRQLIAGAQEQLDQYHVPAYLFASNPAEMQKTLCHLEETYGGATGYLSHIGFSDDEIEVLRHSLLG
ncbi:tyrosine-protein phosphatase [Neobittarella massiliensis]|uniref:Tyrosine-protein phosphatase n=2 Tax=Oscillospiraceae TaxID=216572 RepID=A0A8J6IJZ8_9FIRM|nr:tyrosine-protein phosphatase [Neobittarella massiliensis]MBC3515966.1 tyrosine-protein phosphatase [Neobittarella massiliensis]SCJ41081.1 Tyrosine-protein phosphatase precursor [uncultured Anaerotruncus sp.]